MKIYKVIKIGLPHTFNIRNLKRFDFKKLRRYRKKIKRILILFILLLFLWIGIKGFLEKNKPAAEQTTSSQQDQQEGKKGFWAMLIDEILPSSNKKENNPYSENSKVITEEGDSLPFYSQEAAQIRSQYFSVDSSAYLDERLLTLESLENGMSRVELKSQEPKILIFHTHSQEDFSDSRPDVWEDTIVGIGQTLSEILAQEYGVTVVHDIGKYDLDEQGKLNRGSSYERMEKSIQKLLKKYPSIEVLIDLHRDGVNPDVHLATTIDGKQTARIMFVNGVCCLNEDGLPRQTDNLSNPYLVQNLAFSYQMQKKSDALYPEFARKIYIKPYRYSLHMKPMSLLVEVGANTNTVEEALNAMPHLAKILYEVLESNQVQQEFSS